MDAKKLPDSKSNKKNEIIIHLLVGEMNSLQLENTFLILQKNEHSLTGECSTKCKINRVDCFDHKL